MMTGPIPDGHTLLYRRLLTLEQVIRYATTPHQDYTVSGAGDQDGDIFTHSQSAIRLSGALLDRIEGDEQGMAEARAFIYRRWAARDAQN